MRKDTILTLLRLAEAPSSDNKSMIGGQRVSTPTVYGSGVVSLQPCSTPPKQTMEESPDVAVLAALREAAAEKLQSYRSRIMCGDGGEDPSAAGAE